LFAILTTTFTQDALTELYPAQTGVHRHLAPAKTFSPLTSKTKPRKGQQEGHKPDSRTEIRTDAPRIMKNAPTVHHIRARQGKQYGRSPCEPDPRADERPHHSTTCKPIEHTEHTPNDWGQRGVDATEGHHRTGEARHTRCTPHPGNPHQQSRSHTPTQTYQGTTNMQRADTEASNAQNRTYTLAQCTSHPTLPPLLSDVLKPQQHPTLFLHLTPETKYCPLRPQLA